jgi:CHAD domain-containing protein
MGIFPGGVESAVPESDSGALERQVAPEKPEPEISVPTEVEAGAVAVPGFVLDVDTLPELNSPGISPDDPMSEAGRKTLWFHFLRMLRHEPGTRAGEDIEELHDMRVATRRMRAAIRVFGDFYEPKVIAPFNKGLRRAARALGPVRDLDVFEEKAKGYRKKLPKETRGGLDPLLEAWQEERGTARQKMINYLDSERNQRFKLSFGGFLQTEGAGARSMRPGHPVPYQVRHVAPRLVYTRYEAVRAYETVLDDAQIETLHALRIDCKYLRYTLEFLREVMGPEVEAVIEEVKAMQDHLGDLNDAEVAIDLLSEFLGDWDAAQATVPLSQRRSAEGVVTYLAARHAEKHRLLTTFPEAWTRLNREEVRRWMALAVAAL